MNELRQQSYGALHDRDTKLFLKEHSEEGLTPEERQEQQAIKAEKQKRQREYEQFRREGGNFICEADMARWGIEYSDCIDFPSNL